MDRFIYFIAATLLAIVRLFPLIICFRAGEFLGLVVWLLLPQYRKLAYRNLHVALGKELTPREREKLVRKSFSTMGANILCSIKIPSMTPKEVRQVITFEGEEYWNKHIASNHGRGTVVALSHFGNWELNAQIATFVEPRRAGTVYQALRNRSLDELINRDRRSRGVKTFDRRRGLAAAANFLREGGVVGVLIDQHAGDAGIWMPFLNKMASTSPLAATLAQKTNSELIHLTIHTTAPGRWTIRVNPPVVTKDRTVAEITYELGEQLAQEIRRSPWDWFWVHNRWKLPKPAFLLARVKRGFYLPEKCNPQKLTPLKLLVRSPNWLGDACMAAPAICSLKKGRPDLQLTILSPQKLAALWKRFPEVDHIIEIPFKASPWNVASLLKKEAVGPQLPPFDIALLLPNSVRSALEVCLAGIPRRIGRVGKKGCARKWLINQPFPEVKKVATYTHEAEEYETVAYWLGAEAFSEPLHKTSTNNLNSAEGLSTRPLRVGICPGAEYGTAKRWPIDRFRAVIDSLSPHYNITWVIVGTKAEESLAAGLLETFEGCAENHVGKTTLDELITLVQGLDVLITNDTGTMHLADIFGIPTVAIFGSTEPALTGPRGQGHEILRHPVECSPCFLRTCPIDFPCMKGITPEEVVAATIKILEKR